MRRGLLNLALLAALAAWPAAAGAQVEGVPATPIPSDPAAADLREFIGSPATPDPVSAPQPPQHPFMAPNGRSNLHNDAYMSDAYWEQTGPLGLGGMETDSALFLRECASATFDSRGRIVTICVGLDMPVLALLDPDTFEVLASRPLPPRIPLTTDPLRDFTGGGYFYLDNRDRAVLPTTTRHVLRVAIAGSASDPRFVVVDDWDVSRVVGLRDGIVSVLPDWSGRIWFASRAGVVGFVRPGNGSVESIDLGEPIHNSFAVDETGGVYIVSDAALYRFAVAAGRPSVSWRATYDNVGIQKPGQTQAGSGTTPTLLPDGYVAITDNADPMQVVVLRSDPAVPDSQRLVCEEPVFDRGRSATDQSLIGAGRSLVAENNHGYTGPASTTDGKTTAAGLTRVDIAADGSGCATVWESRERAPSVVPKLSLPNGLVYTYTKPFRADELDTWYFTALDFDTGATVYRRLAGVGLGYNNHFSPVTIGPDATAYVGELGGIALFRDG